MNKTELIDAVAETADLTKAESARAVDAVVAAVTKALKSGDAVTLVGFGTFQVRDRNQLHPIRRTEPICPRACCTQRWLPWLIRGSPAIRSCRE